MAQLVVLFGIGEVEHVVIGDAYLIGDDGRILGSFFVGGDCVEIPLARDHKIALHFRRRVELAVHLQVGGFRSPRRGGGRLASCSGQEQGRQNYGKTEAKTGEARAERHNRLLPERRISGATWISRGASYQIVAAGGELERFVTVSENEGTRIGFLSPSASYARRKPGGK